MDSKIAVGAILGSALTTCFFTLLQRQRQRQHATSKTSSSSPPSLPLDSTLLPPFALKLQASKHHQRVLLREWYDPEWRRDNGWLGTDLIHHREGNGVRVLDYYWNISKKELVGVVHFGVGCESHRGLCHGGAYTSLFDDFCGHIAFVSGAGPWCGATVQVNVTLKRPILIGSVLRVIGTYEKKGRKIIVSAVLDDGDEEEVEKEVEEKSEEKSGSGVYAVLEGVSVGGKGILISSKEEHKKDKIGVRSWNYGRNRMWDDGWGEEGPPLLSCER